MRSAIDVWTAARKIGRTAGRKGADKCRYRRNGDVEKPLRSRRKARPTLRPFPADVRSKVSCRRSAGANLATRRPRRRTLYTRHGIRPTRAPGVALARKALT